MYLFIEKLLGDTRTDRQNGDFLSLIRLFEESGLKWQVYISKEIKHASLRGIY
jgi:hypothetical protein